MSNTVYALTGFIAWAFPYQIADIAPRHKVPGTDITARGNKLSIKQEIPIESGRPAEQRI
jgi:hypothetical protein